jgi:hypothetical protein
LHVKGTLSHTLPLWSYANRRKTVCALFFNEYLNKMQ